MNVVARRPCTLLMLFTVSILETASLPSWLYGRRRSPYHPRTQPCKSPSHAPLISSCDTMSSSSYFLYPIHLNITFMYSSPTFAPPSSLYPTATTTTPMTKPNPHTHKLTTPSPPQINHTSRLKAPLLILSGAVDNIVPPNQAQLMADRINKEGEGDGGRTVELKIYEGEGHVFAKGSTLEDMEVRRERWFRRWLVGE